MEEKELVRRIKLLKQVKPPKDWVVFCRSRLAFRMEMERKKNLLNKDFFALGELFSFWRLNQPQMAFRAIYASIIAFGVILGGGGLVAWAAIQSLPGAPLYPVKIALEKALVSVSLSDEGRLELQAKLVDKRFQELKDVVESQESAEQKVERVVQVVESIQNQMVAVNNQLPKPDVKTEPQKALAAAKIVSKKASQAGKVLADAREALPTNKPDLNSKLAAAAEAAEKAGIEALETMIINQGETGVKNEEIAVKLSEEINKTKKEIEAKEQKIVQQDTPADKLPIRAVLINQFEQSLGLLDKAGEALKKEDFKAALDALKTAKTIDSGTEKMTQNVSNQSDKNATSSAPADTAK
jgi:hypothetical protein